MAFTFSKMHGLGNDFIVIDGVQQKVHLSPAQITALSNRHTGIGFDQCLLVEKSLEDGIDFFYRIYNANGQEVGQCGNGARCLAKFIVDKGLTDKKSITVATNTTKMHLKLLADNTVTVEFGIPKLAPKDIPFLMPSRSKMYEIALEKDEKYMVHAINVGNPHIVLKVADVTSVEVNRIGKLISGHKFFPEQTNVGFMSVDSHNEITLRVYERGCGETMACGSGAVAAAAIGRLYYNLDEEITVALLGGDLKVIWPKINGPIYLNGPATFVYDGFLEEICEL